MAVLCAAHKEGYDGQFVARSGAVECETCSSLISPEQLPVVRIRRLEGASDAADEIMMAWIACPACGTRGTLILGYGPNSSDDDVAVLHHLPTETASAAPADSEIEPT